MGDEADDLFGEIVRQAQRAAILTAQERVDRMVRIATKDGLTISDEVKAEMLAFYVHEAGRLN